MKYSAKRTLQSTTKASSDVEFSPLNLFTEDVDTLKREIWIYSEIDEVVAFDTIRDIMAINDHDLKQERAFKEQGNKYNRQPIKLYINSIGGCVYQGLAIISAIESSITPVHTIGIGVVMSMGVPILASGHIRSCNPHTTFMLHTVLSNLQGTMAEINNNVKESNRLFSKLTDIITESSDISQEQMEGLIDSNVDWNFDEVEALRLGLISSVTGTSKFKCGDVVTLDGIKKTVNTLHGSYVELLWFEEEELLREYVLSRYLTLDPETE